MTSSYVLSTATTRTNGPAVGGTYPAGCFIEDYAYTSGAGDLDARNGRFCITPEYPSGTYAYFVTIDAALNPVFPYTFYGTYYGVVQPGNTGMGSGHNTITGSTTVYNGTVGVDEAAPQIKFTIAPNPVTDYAFIYFDPSSANNIKGEIYDAQGKLLFTQDYLQPSISYSFDFTKYAAGNYFLHLSTDKQNIINKIVKVK